MEIFAIFLVIGITTTAHARLEPTKLVTDQIYRLLSQHDGRYLGEGQSQIPTKTQGTSGNEKFKFVSSNDDLWTLIGLSSNEPLGSTTWKVSYVGHGKYQFKDIKTGLCLQGTGVEGSCGRDNPLQRWFVELAP